MLHRQNQCKEHDCKAEEKRGNAWLASVEGSIGGLDGLCAGSRGGIWLLRHLRIDE